MGTRILLGIPSHNSNSTAAQVRESHPAIDFIPTILPILATTILMEQLEIIGLNQNSF
jgi:hypothetical protein